MRIQDTCKVIPEGSTHMRVMPNQYLMAGGVFVVRVVFYKVIDGKWFMYASDPENEYPQWRRADWAFRDFNPESLTPMK